VQTISVLAGRTTSIEATDKEQMGAITISKQGEVLTGWDGENFTYMTRKLPGAAFTVTAGADIYKADGTKVYSEGDVIAENLVTGSDGEVVLNNLRLGTYVVTETKSIEGYTINTEPQTVNITYKDQMVEVQYEATTITNTRQKANVAVEKVDSDTGNPLLEAEFTLYAANDIANYDGEVIVEKDTALETVTTDEEGSAAYTIDLPIQNSYYIAETKAPYGYYRNQDDTYTFDFTYLPETEEEITFSHTFMNDRTTAKIEIHKLDKETQTAVPQGVGKLSGAVYGVYAKENIIHPDGLTGVIFNAGDLVAKITTETDGVGYADGLYLGSYIIKELEPSDGYLIDEEEYEITCEYEDDLVAEVVGSVTSYEQVIKAEFSKVDSAGNKIAGAKLSVLDANGNVVESWTTEVGKSHTIAGIPASGYALREESAPYGYKVASDVIFTIARTPEIQKISMTDEKITGKIIIEKTNEKNKKPIAGVEFEIRDANGALIETLVTDEKGEACSKELAICTYNSDGSYKEDIKYYVVETKAAAGYILDSTKHEIVLRQTAETKDIVTYTLSVTNRPTRLKLPQTGGNYNPWLLGGIGFGIAALGFALATKKKKMEELEHDEL
jgi:LPXTG-motif cell wall-anchored protein